MAVAPTNVYWLELTLADVPGNNSWLGARELSRLNSLRIEKRRSDWRLGRWTAKRAVAAYTGLRPANGAFAGIEICPAPSGAPEAFMAATSAPPAISLSHCDGVAFCVVAAPGTAIGCDLEMAAPRSEAFIADYFTGDEHALLSQMQPPSLWTLLALLWSAKESALKTLREGLRLDTRSVTVSPSGISHCAERNSGGGEYWQPLQARLADAQILEGWWRQTDDRVHTVLAAPRPALPVRLSPSLEHGKPARDAKRTCAWQQA